MRNSIAVIGGGKGDGGIMSVYMAGSMGTADGGDWRQGWRPDTLPDADIVCNETLDVKPVLVSVGQHKFFYTGPFGDDMSNHSFVHGLDSAYGFEPAVFRRSIIGLNRADVVLARIDEVVDCHGTLAEIGYAYGKGIPVYVMRVVSGSRGDIVVSRGPSETVAWFATAMARRVVTVTSDRIGEGMQMMADLAIAEKYRRSVGL